MHFHSLQCTWLLCPTFIKCIWSCISFLSIIIAVLNKTLTYPFETPLNFTTICYYKNCYRYIIAIFGLSNFYCQFVQVSIALFVNVSFIWIDLFMLLIQSGSCVFPLAFLLGGLGPLKKEMTCFLVNYFILFYFILFLLFCWVQWFNHSVYNCKTF
jgi:hypothetical protein